MIFDGIHRRFFLKVLAAAGLVATTETGATGCAAPDEDEIEADDSAITLEGFEYVIVGSGAGGGPLAANLARQGHKVLLLEAGNDQGNNPHEYVPAFHAKSTEDDEMSWDFFVKHYDDEQRAAKDSKMTWTTPDGKQHVGPNPPAGSKQKGILYPRAGTLGGCTAHNALIHVYPHESDWNKIAQLTGDASWAAGNMRRYYEILTRSEYLGDNTGWMGVNKADANLALRDLKILTIVKAAAITMGQSLIGDIGELLGIMRRDLNEAGSDRDKREGLYQIPLAMSGNKRNGPREYLLDTVKKGFPLTIKTNCLATRVLFSTRPGADGKQKAVGVEFLMGEKLYRASPKPGQADGVKHRALCSREVILAAGAYNTPQLLKLSGVGPKEELAKFRIPLKVDLKGVGTNLQDRYEVGVISTVKDDFALLDKCTFGAPGDPCMEEWKRTGGPYASNGIAVAMVKKSSASTGDPDLFVFGGPANFPGYFPGYSDNAVKDKRHFTWAVLKAHTGNSAGTVTLKSADPRDVPDINFKYFDNGTTNNNAHERDLQAVYEGVELARKVGRQTGDLMLDDLPFGLGGKFEEQVPGPRYQGSQATKEFIKNEAWGHHASCTCPIGKDGDPNAVLDSKFRVRGTTGLRVVDASVFPQIPGFFIVVPIYMVSEKATDAILEDLGERRRF